MVAAVAAGPPVRGQANSCVHSLDVSVQHLDQSRLAPCPSELALVVVPQHDAAQYLRGQTECIAVA